MTGHQIHMPRGDKLSIKQRKNIFNLSDILHDCKGIKRLIWSKLFYFCYLSSKTPLIARHCLKQGTHIFVKSLHMIFYCGTKCQQFQYIMCLNQKTLLAMTPSKLLPLMPNLRLSFRVNDRNKICRSEYIAFHSFIKVLWRWRFRPQHLWNGMFSVQFHKSLSWWIELVSLMRHKH